MADTTNISWTDRTHNEWVGCQKTGSIACEPCYAENLMDTRFGRVKWGGPHQGSGTRALTSPQNRRRPLAWEKEAAADALLPKKQRQWPHGCFVFANSLSDVFDPVVERAWLRGLFDTIRATPHLTWLLLTKRPQHIVRLFAEAMRIGEDADDLNEFTNGKLFAAMWPRNAAIGCTVVTQDEADRDIPELLLAAEALNPAFTFVSIEPMASEIDLTRISTFKFRGAEILNALTGQLSGLFGDYVARSLPRIDWVIAGGCTDQGKHKAFPSLLRWFRSLRDQCKQFGVAFHFKQWGEWVPAGPKPSGTPGRFAYGDHEHEPGRMVEVDYFPRQMSLYGARAVMERVGKTKAGRLLDGKLHDARPVPRAA